MLQVVRLVNPGRPDKVIAFEGLPEDLLDADNPRTEKINVRLTGLGRAWSDFSPIHYPIFFKTINQDKERWQKISNYVRQFAEDGVRLMDKIEDMASPIAPDCNSQANDPEIVPVIKLKQINPPKAEEPAPVQAAPVTPVSPVTPAAPVVAPTPAPSAISPLTLKIGEVKPVQKIKVAHADHCTSLGRNARYTKNCPRCDAYKEVAEKKLVNV